MKLGNNARVFLAVLALAFALQVTFDLNSDWQDPLKTFLQRLGVSMLIAVAVAFFWGQFRRNR